MISIINNLKQELDNIDHPTLPSPIGDARRRVKKAEEELKKAKSVLKERLKKKSGLEDAIKKLEEEDENKVQKTES